MSASQRNKGAAFEREVAIELTRMFGREVKRTLGQARDGGADIEVGGILFECKRRKSFRTLYQWWAQVKAAVRPKWNSSTQEARYPVPVLVVRADGEEALVVVQLKDLEAFSVLVRGL